MMIDVLFADFPNVENSSEKITVCFGLFWLGKFEGNVLKAFFCGTASVQNAHLDVTIKLVRGFSR